LITKYEVAAGFETNGISVVKRDAAKAFAPRKCTTGADPQVAPKYIVAIVAFAAQAVPVVKVSVPA